MAKHPVVVYGASGYTGMLIMDWLIDQNIPFTAVARNAGRAKEMMAQRVVRLESAEYEIIEAEHNVDSLVNAFRGAKVVCNTVGPFSNFGLVGVEAALKAGCHYLDTTGEQSYIRNVRDQFGELYRQAGLLVSSSNAYMYTFAEIAAELALETPGVDALETATLTRGPRGAAGVSVGSTATIFDGSRHESCYLWEKKLTPTRRTRRSPSPRPSSCSRCSACRGAARRCPSTSNAIRACAAAFRASASTTTT
nr:saccharopine dehydrogenase NADP-binding domain-containing protein [Burkholderia ubonensis]